MVAGRNGKKGSELTFESDPQVAGQRAASKALKGNAGRARQLRLGSAVYVFDGSSLSKVSSDASGRKFRSYVANEFAKKDQKK